MLTIKNLSFYHTKDLRPLLTDFNFTLLPGMKVALIGEEGNGKSTLLKAIAEPESLRGFMEIKGEINREQEVIGYLPQILSEEVLDQTTEDYLYSKLDWFTFDYKYFYAMLAELDLPENRISPKLTLRQLSGGEKIKLQLLGEMLKRPTVLLLDEPSNDLDLASVQWLEDFIHQAEIPLMFVSHDEILLQRCANTIIHLEQLVRKSKPQHTIASTSYEEYVQNRENKILKQITLAKKEKEEYEAKMERYRQIYQRVQHELRTIPKRGSDSIGKNLKDKMQSVKSLGRRFAREKERITERPDYEESILISFTDKVFVPNDKRLLDLQVDVLQAGEHILSRNIKLSVFGPQKICIIGPNGAGKTTLLRLVLQNLRENQIRYGYMPQDYSETMNLTESAVQFLAESSHKDELTRVRTYLGSMNFTQEEMFRPIGALSGGQRAKLYFSKLILTEAEVLVLDEPTRNLSPLSAPEIRRALQEYSGCIIAVSHDRKLIQEVFQQVLQLDETGLNVVVLH